jgi:hypothetical protein
VRCVIRKRFIGVHLRALQACRFCRRFCCRFCRFQRRTGLRHQVDHLLQPTECHQPTGLNIIRVHIVVGLAVILPFFHPLGKNRNLIAFLQHPIPLVDAVPEVHTHKNCYLQMAERHPAYDGFEAGVIVLTAEGQLLSREGSIVYDGDSGETLLGGWAKVYRKDRTRASYEEVKLSEYDTGKSLWNGKKATMIRKVALVHALREAFPSTFGALYDESEVRVDAESTAREVPPEELPVLDPYAGSHRHRKTAGTLIPAPDAPSAEENADDPFGGDDA